jgi:hypothetical protein
MHLPAATSLRKVIGFALLTAMTLAAAPAASAPPATARSELIAAAADAATAVPTVLGRERTTVPEDRYAMAGGCYTVRTATGPGYLTRTGDGGVTLSSDAEPFHFQATRLGSYLLYGTAQDFVAATDGEVGKGAKTVTESGVGGAVGGLTMENTDRAAEDISRGPAGTASGRGAALEMAAEPSELADWQVEQGQDQSFTFLLPSIDRALGVDDHGEVALVAPGDAAGFRLLLTDGCADFPEIDSGISGDVVGGDTPYSEVSGYLEAHLHMMAFEFLGGRARCGRPWHPYGAEYALQGCPEHEIAGGRAAVLETVLSGRDPVAGHDTNAGWPTFTDWPKHGSLTYEQVYYTWMERFWRGGLRMFVNLLVDNVQLCNLYPYKSHGCDEMETVRLEAQRTFELQDYIDAQYGGPGRGWFRIVDDPFEARRVMNSGKLAVVLGIEVSRLFDCRLIAATGTSTCTTEQIDQRLDEVYDMGVRQMELVNKFDNALSGVTGDGGETGVVVNGGNFLETGGFWQMRTCEDTEDGHAHAHDKQQYNFHDESGAPDELSGRDSLVGILLQELGGSGAAPAYGEGPHCNDLGLSELGEHLISRMIDKGMIFDPDHMSAKARTQSMDIIEAAGYSGVISSHGWADDTIYPRIMAAGGVVTPHAGSSASFVQKYRAHRSWADERYYYGIGFGADTNGFSTQGGPRGADAENPVTYPFTGFGGVTVDRNVSGERIWDINTDGVAHYGLYPDWIQDVVNLLGDEEGEQFLTDMARGPEAYLQMWERAMGVAPDACRSDVAEGDGFAAVRNGMTPEQVLLAAGQPVQRSGDTFTFCVGTATATVTFGPDGTVEEVTALTGGSKPDQRNGKPAAATAPAATDDRGMVPVDHDHDSHDHGMVELASATTAAETGRSIALIAFIALFVMTQLRPGRRQER